MKVRNKKLGLLTMLVCGAAICSTYSFLAYAQYVTSKLAPPPPVIEKTPASKKLATDSIGLRFKVRETVPKDYKDLYGGEYAADLKTPANITTDAEYDYETGCYVVSTKLGDDEIATPFMLSSSDYNNLMLRQSMQEYYR